jgi:hypothetical protein
LSKACQPGASADADQSPLPNVAAALAQRKALRILAFGAAPGRINARGGYTTLIENMLAHALKGVDVVMINRGVSGELAAGAASRMKNEVALEEPDLVRSGRSAPTTHSPMCRPTNSPRPSRTRSTG